MAEQEHRKPDLSEALTIEAAKLAGVADTLRNIMGCEENLGNIIGMLSNVVDGVNEKISDVAMHLVKNRRVHTSGR